MHPVVSQKMWCGHQAILLYYHKFFNTYLKPIAFLSGTKSQWDANPLARVARDELKNIPDAVIVYVKCEPDHEITLAQVNRVLGIGHLIDIEKGSKNHALDSYFITTDIDLWPLNKKNHTLSPDKQILVTRPLGVTNKNIDIALSCLGMKGKTWKEISTFEDCNTIEKTNPEEFLQQCGEEGLRLWGRYIKSPLIGDRLDTAEKILKYCQLFKGDEVFEKNHGKGNVNRNTWFLDQKLASALVTLWARRHVRSNSTEWIGDYVEYHRKNVNRLNRGKGMQGISRPDFDLSIFQDAHLGTNAHRDSNYQYQILPLLKKLLSPEEVDLMSSYQKLFISKWSEWNEIFSE